MTDELHVRRWRCHGHDRLYVQTPHGQRLGYYDLTTHSAHAADEALIPIVLTAAGAYLRSSDTGSEDPTVARIEPDPVLWQVIDSDDDCARTAARRTSSARLRSLIIRKRGGLA